MDHQCYAKDFSKSVPYSEEIDFSVIQDKIHEIGKNNYTKDIPISLNFMDKPRTPRWVPKSAEDFEPFLNLKENPWEIKKAQKNINLSVETVSTKSENTQPSKNLQKN